MTSRDNDIHSPWLREQIDDPEILALFTDDSEKLKVAVRHLIARASEDLAMESRLIDTLETALDQRSDDSDASVWIAVILGEVQSHDALGVLARCHENEEDELLQDAADVALLRIGGDAIAHLMEEVEEGRGHLFNRATYRLLGQTGLLNDEILRRRVLEFLDERLPVEQRVEPGESAIEELVEACARLGHTNALNPIKKVLSTHYHGVNPVLEDAIEMLEENSAGVAFVPTTTPWDERYGWVFEDQLDQGLQEHESR